MPLILALLSPVLACEPPVPYVDGFDWLEAAVDVPTDVHIPVFTDSAQVVVVRLDTGEATPATFSRRLGGPLDDRVLYAPDAPLAPNTAYRVDATFGIADRAETVSTTFTTGAGPAPALAAPVLAEGPEATRWRNADPNPWICTIGEPLESRTIRAELSVPAGTPAGSYGLLASDGTDPDLVVTLDPVEPEIALVFDQARNDDDETDRDCLVPSLVGPNGVEVVGDEVCVERGLGCSTTGAAGSWALVLLASAFARRRRR